ncbi:unnamed protein product [Paramecium octaurelia]|uniref:Uncharacterized protein n=1 Tax=Paramecium octaurelia TaxID=43137 RepID=A0A8S1U3M3_PAROT|nr:unnamed protein product [Paramecium octaurelia]
MEFCIFMLYLHQKKSFIATSNLKTSFSTYLDIFTYLKFGLSKITNHSQSLNGSKNYINPEMPLKLDTKYKSIIIILKPTQHTSKRLKNSMTLYSMNNSHSDNFQVKQIKDYQPKNLIKDQECIQETKKSFNLNGLRKSI